MRYELKKSNTLALIFNLFELNACMSYMYKTTSVPGQTGAHYEGKQIVGQKMTVQPNILQSESDGRCVKKEQKLSSSQK